MILSCLITVLVRIHFELFPMLKNRNIRKDQPDKFEGNGIDVSVPTYVLQRRSTVSSCSPLRIIDEGVSDAITPSKDLD